MRRPRGRRGGRPRALRSSPTLKPGGHRGTLDVAGVTVRSIRLADVGPDGEALLDPAERARAAGITDPATRRDFLAGRIALREFAAGILAVSPGDLSTAYSCPDCGTGPELDHGRPGYRLRQGPARLGLSLSRSHGWALLAAGPVGPDRPAGFVRPAGAAGVTIGVDLEHSSGVLFPGFDDVALTPAERRLLAALSPDQATLWRTAAWARKEALLKARGTGLRIEPSSVEAYAEPRNGTMLVDLDTVALGLPPGFASALAVVGVE